MSTRQWALVWSHRNNALRVEPLEEVLSAARAAYESNESADYVPILVGERAVLVATARSCSQTLLTRARRAFAEAAA